MKIVSAAWLAVVVGGVGMAAALAGCGEKQPVMPKRELEVYKSDAEPERELTIDEQRDKLEKERENQPEPTLDANDPREKNELVWKNGKSALRSAYEERGNVLTQLKAVTFDDKLDDQRKRLAPLTAKIEAFGIGESTADLETAATRFCTVVDELRTGADALKAEGEGKLKEIDAAIAELEAKQKAGKPVTTKQYSKLEDDRKMWSAPVLGAGYVYMAMRTLYDEAYVLADFGARREQVALRDCIGKAGATPVPYDPAEAARNKTLKRARYYKP